MKPVWSRIIFLLLLAYGSRSSSNAQTLHRLPIESVRDLHAFFKWDAKKQTLVSGPRGGRVPGFPENSLATFDNTLKHTPPSSRSTRA